MDIGSLTVIFAYFLIGSSKRVLLLFFCLSFSSVIFVYNTRCLISLTKKNPEKLGLNPGQMVLTVPDWVACFVA